MRTIHALLAVVMVAATGCSFLGGSKSKSSCPHLADLYEKDNPDGEDAISRDKFLEGCVTFWKTCTENFDKDVCTQGSACESKAKTFADAKVCDEVFTVADEEEESSDDDNDTVDEHESTAKAKKGEGERCTYTQECESRPGMRCARPRGAPSSTKTTCMLDGY